MTAPVLTGPWHPLAPQQFVDKRSRWTKQGIVEQRVRAYRGLVVSKGEKGPVYDRCPHAHNKPSAARKCAERAAARLNKGAQHGEQD